MKLHVSILTPATIKMLLVEGRDLVDVPMSQHTLDRITEKSLQAEDVRTAILEGSLIEYHTDAGTRRVLFRHDAGTCVVLDLDTRKVITAYFNAPSDNHSTLRAGSYMFGTR
jgi:hypothetical protein